MIVRWIKRYRFVTGIVKTLSFKILDKSNLSIKEEHVNPINSPPRLTFRPTLPESQQSDSTMEEHWPALRSWRITYEFPFYWDWVFLKYQKLWYDILEIKDYLFIGLKSPPWTDKSNIECGIVLDEPRWS